MEKYRKINSLEEAIQVKSSILSHGIRIDPMSGDFKPSKPSLYSYEISDKPTSFVFPQEVILYQNNDLGIRVFSTVRFNVNSPWTLTKVDGHIVLKNQEVMFEIDLPVLPEFYKQDIPGEDATKYFQKLGGDTIALVMLNYCEYYARDVQCRFCEIHENFSSTENQFLRVKQPEKMASYLVSAIRRDPSIRQIIFNSGNYSRNNNRTYFEMIKTLEFTIQELTPEELNRVAFLIIVAPPEDFQLIEKLKNAGATSVYINLEVWDEDTSRQVVPGKYAVGRDTYFRAFDHALKYFGKGYVYTNLILGIQAIDMTKDEKHFHEEREMQILYKALDDLIARDVLLTNTIYHSSGKNKIGRIHIPQEAIAQFHMYYGERILQSGLVSSLCDGKNAVYASFEAIPNSLNNETYTYHKFKNMGVAA
jgi:hypothetical protein